MILKDKTFAKILPRLPLYSYSIHKKRMEPITLVLLGSKSSISDELLNSGWFLSGRISLISTIKSAFATIADTSYHKGPMWPAFVNGKQNMMGFEMPTRSDTYRRRHHMRLWKTRFKLGGIAIWVGTISYEHGVGLVKRSLIPTHHISPTLELEDEYLARTLELLKPVYVRLAKPEEGLINTGDAYIWNGKALVIDLTK